jgi:LmbE family N-acetylglucosaminyl deacetylase
MNIENEHIPCKRPHYQLRGNQLYFLISKRPHLELGPEDLSLWNSIDGKTTVAELHGRFPDVHERIERFWECEVIEVAQSAFGSSRKRVLIIEPHMDDAILSVGGLMWELREICEFTVVSVTGHSNFTSYHRINRDFFDVNTVTSIRREESELVMRVLGGKHAVLDTYDAPLRYQPGNWTLEWHARNRRAISAFINHSSTDAEVHACANSIQQMLMDTDAQEIWIPLGVGTSADHEMTRNASLLSLMRMTDLFRRVDVCFYQDVPYAMNFPRHTDQILAALVSRGASVEKAVCDITDSMSAKLRLISIYASQFKMTYMRPKVEMTARMNGQSDGRWGELLVRLDKLPDQLKQFDVYSGCLDVVELVGRLGGWLRRNRTAERITILCPMGVGRWKEYMDFLLRSFPNATFEFHITEDASDETKRFRSSRIEIRPVNGQASAWVLRIFRVMFLRSRPIIVFTGNRYRKMLRVIRAVCVLSDPLPVTTINHLVQALRFERGQSSAVGCPDLES